ncbi:hypothetical protein FNU3_102 [Fusobacterium phage vB_FnuS_FNU3]|uniref:Uncharacterized protein n=1 Tax=Fusobacterium phage Fnu1 TaxID=2530024 RepID=A0A481W5U8_9CAUD|nr:hypothetical protein KMD24_gp104 [Fusobacterium phage Fnu1]QBJ04138.1 hypothetical protein [Fusobacterium phage Fnu1]WGH50404.1 hypothetical protein FNU3_102 [Fusobacterium phage vB_FnuS_FNU3]
MMMSFIVNIGGSMIKDNRIELSKKMRADYREKYMNNLLEHIKKELVSKDLDLKNYLVECYNKGVYVCEFDVDIDTDFITHINLADNGYTSIKDMFLENQYKGFLATINNYIIEKFNLQGCIDSIKSYIMKRETIEESAYSEYTYIDEYLHTEIIFKD